MTSAFIFSPKDFEMRLIFLILKQINVVSFVLPVVYFSTCVNIRLTLCNYLTERRVS